MPVKAVSPNHSVVTNPCETYSHAKLTVCFFHNFLRLTCSQVGVAPAAYRLRTQWPNTPLVTTRVELSMSSPFFILSPLPFHFLIALLCVKCIVVPDSCGAKDPTSSLVKPPCPIPILQLLPPFALSN